MPDLVARDEEDALRDAVRGMLARRCSTRAVLASIDAPTDLTNATWQSLAKDLGVLALPITTDEGGAGGSWVDAAAVLTELGRAVAPVPFLGSAVIATALAQRVGASDLIKDLIGGAIVAVPSITGTEMAIARLNEDAVTAHYADTIDVIGAQALLIAIGDELLQVAVDDLAVQIMPVVSLDVTRPSAGVAIDGASVRGRYALPDGALAEARDIGMALLAAEQVGLAEWCLDATIRYVMQRRQFGRLVGSYQAVKHRCADLWVELTQARAVARYAAWCAKVGDPDLPIAATLAQAYCSGVAVHIAEECIQLHGGLGFTWEFPGHLYLKRARSSALIFGAPDEHRDRLGALLDLQEGASVGAGHDVGGIR